MLYVGDYYPGQNFTKCKSLPLHECKFIVFEHSWLNSLRTALMHQKLWVRGATHSASYTISILTSSTLAQIVSGEWLPEFSVEPFLTAKTNEEGLLRTLLVISIPQISFPGPPPTLWAARHTPFGKKCLKKKGEKIQMVWTTSNYSQLFILTLHSVLFFFFFLHCYIFFFFQIRTKLYTSSLVQLQQHSIVY